jgi:NADPH:quinone reductase-like Zn-dependent oxidoreductase
MKAIRLHNHGGPEEIVYEDVPLPTLRAGDALVKVLASGLTRNELDWGPTYTDEQGVGRLPIIPGHELCGIVEKLASGVSNDIIGTTVYGLTSFFRDGTAAEYVAVKATDLAPKPMTLTPIQAAAVPLSALTAWQALFQYGGLKAGKKLLIHGAAGGVGTFAIQLAHWCGAQVIGATDHANFKLVSELGADEVIDYQAGPFERQTHPVDMVLDTIGGDIQARSWPLLNPGGVLVSIAGESLSIPPAFHDRQGVFFIVEPNYLQLLKIGDLIDRGAIRPIIAKVIPLPQAKQAFEKLLERGNQGKLVLQVI